VLHLKSEKGFSASTNAIYSHVIPAPELGATVHFIKPANKCLLIVEFQVLIRVFKKIFWKYAPKVGFSTEN
jgi:hypothetical protein